MNNIPRQTLDRASQEFLGRGWSFPVALEQGHAAMVELQADVKQAIRIILGTEPGERVMRPDFGTPLRGFVFELMNTTNFEMIRSCVEQALQHWEPSIDVLRVVVQPGGAGSAYERTRTGRLDIEIDYCIRTTNTKDNLVYPFYLTEAPRQ